jgi:hypothetical protein
MLSSCQKSCFVFIVIDRIIGKEWNWQFDRKENLFVKKMRWEEKKNNQIFSSSRKDLFDKRLHIHCMRKDFK